ncbi:photosystem II oxygen evolving complex [Chlorella sorokiniana]|uniref:Photosystem II oxygen evolving complex n=1 Tax=Chlorella sorokiniana TaxID=3076 RepID=A0A2P6TIC5_CHLSO|nr:photosystem II oxygen evolving complex [Chlorella sorokiniana]|eukprot:PRW34042.1 photosystem II oxygen evolving complex [Chlorella sorokiniana]
MIATAATAPRPVQPLPVPPLTETFTSPEGFAFDYPGDGTWVVAFDRSGSTGNGAVVVVGDFRKLVTVSAFRTETVPEAVRQAGLTQDSGYNVLVEPQRTERGTMRFNLLRSELGTGGAYEYEFSIESCAGEVEEGLGGKLRCLNAFGGAIPTAPRRVIGRSVLVNGTAYSLTASSPEERWEEVGPLLRAVVATFRK